MVSETNDRAVNDNDTQADKNNHQGETAAADNSHSVVPADASSTAKAAGKEDEPTERSTIHELEEEKRRVLESDSFPASDSKSDKSEAVESSDTKKNSDEANAAGDDYLRSCIQESEVPTPPELERATRSQPLPRPGAVAVEGTGPLGRLQSGRNSGNSGSSDIRGNRGSSPRSSWRDEQQDSPAPMVTAELVTEEAPPVLVAAAEVKDDEEVQAEPLDWNNKFVRYGLTAAVCIIILLVVIVALAVTGAFNGEEGVSFDILNVTEDGGTVVVFIDDSADSIDSADGRALEWETAEREEVSLRYPAKHRLRGALDSLFRQPMKVSGDEAGSRPVVVLSNEEN